MSDSPPPRTAGETTDSESKFRHGVSLVISYDGEDFHGFQHQPGLRTVQSAIETAIDDMGIAHSRVRGCSRTDAGVHAQGQVVAFACNRHIDPRGWALALNGHLPDDVVVLSAKTCHYNYNPRFDAERKLYRYLIYTGPVRDPLLRRQSWFLGPRFARKDRPKNLTGVATYLDVEAMTDAAKRLIGIHDFKAFRAVADDREKTERRMFDVRVVPDYRGQEGLLAIEVEGNAFMKNMVRIITGTLVEVGRQRMAPERIDLLLSPEGNRHLAGPTAPPEGLSLVRIDHYLGDHPDAVRPQAP